MAAFTTDAVVLRAHPWSESSRVLKLYCREAGLVSAMARGTRARASKGAGAAAPFSEGVAVVGGNAARDLRSLRDFTPVKARIGLGADYLRLAGASAACELVLGHVAEEEQRDLYDVLSAGLDAVEAAAPSDVGATTLALVWRIVDVLGFAPELRSCTHCGRPLDGREMGRFDVAAGGVACARCPVSEKARRVGPQARADLARLVAGGVPAALRRPWAHASLLGDFLAVHLLGGRPSKAMRQFQDLLRSNARAADSRRP